jgi:NAD(P)-dependent dehydrogenase (short-subunit alcohol dehydrogenase family)
MTGGSLAGANVIIYGGSGAIGAAAARAFSREGATVSLVGRTREKLERVADAIKRTGHDPHVAALDIFDAPAIARHAEHVASSGAGGIQVAVVAIGIPHVQGAPLLDLSLDDFAHPIECYARAHFIAAKAVAPHMSSRKSGVFITVSTQAAKLAFPGVLGFGTACAAIEGFTRHLALELAPYGARAVCIRSNAIAEAAASGSHSYAVFEPVARAQGVSVEAMLENAALATPLRRLPTLEEVAASAVFAASSAASNMTGAVINLTGGISFD